MSDCKRFRERLADAVATPHGDTTTGELAWHEHLLGCAACRRLLEEEEVLDELLATLPEPRLAPELAARVLDALAAARLDALLDLDPEPATPGDLAARVRAGLAPVREDAQLDALLDRVPDPVVPDGLASRVLTGLESERDLTPILRPRFGSRRTLVGVAAAAVLVLVLALGLRPDEPTTEVAVGPSDPEPIEARPVSEEDELLESLDVLENWDLLMDADVDLLLAEIEVLDDVLLLDPLEEGEEEKS